MFDHAQPFAYTSNIAVLVTGADFRDMMATALGGEEGAEGRG